MNEVNQLYIEIFVCVGRERKLWGSLTLFIRVAISCKGLILKLANG